MDTREAFDVWLRDRWYEKDELLEQYVATGRFPASPSDGSSKNPDQGFLETKVQTRHRFEFLQIFTILACVGLLGNAIAKFWARWAPMSV